MDALNTELIPIEINFTDAIGSYVILNNKGIIVSPLFTEEEIDKLKAILRIPEDRIAISTVNMGNPVVRSGAVANDFGLLVGNRTSGVELTRIYTTLLF